MALYKFLKSFKEALHFQTGFTVSTSINYKYSFFAWFSSCLFMIEDARRSIIKFAIHCIYNSSIRFTEKVLLALHSISFPILQVQQNSFVGLHYVEFWLYKRVLSEV